MTKREPPRAQLVDAVEVTFSEDDGGSDADVAAVTTAVVEVAAETPCGVGRKRKRPLASSPTTSARRPG